MNEIAIAVTTICQYPPRAAPCLWDDTISNDFLGQIHSERYFIRPLCEDTKSQFWSNSTKPSGSSLANMIFYETRISKKRIEIWLWGLKTLETHIFNPVGLVQFSCSFLYSIRLEQIHMHWKASHQFVQIRTYEDPLALHNESGHVVIFSSGDLRESMTIRCMYE